MRVLALMQPTVRDTGQQTIKTVHEGLTSIMTLLLLLLLLRAFQSFRKLTVDPLTLTRTI